MRFSARVSKPTDTHHTPHSSVASVGTDRACAYQMRGVSDAVSGPEGQRAVARARKEFGSLDSIKVIV